MVDLDSGGPLVEAPGAQATGLSGVVLPIPFGPTGASAVLLSVSCVLVGWSIRESTGLAAATIELLSGSTAAGELLATIGFTPPAGGSAVQSGQSSSASGANAAQVASITAGAGLLAFVTSLRITGLGATAATVVTATLTGCQGGTISYPVTVPAGATVAITPVTDSFGGAGLASAAPGGTIALNLPAFGAGNTLEQAQLTGYVQQLAADDSTSSTAGAGLQARNGVFLNVISGSVRGVVWVMV